MSLLYADTTAAASGAAPMAGAAAGPVSPLDGLLHSPLPVMIIIFGLFWWLFIRPQQKQAKERESQLKQLKEGDRVIMVSGVHATVTRVESDDVLRLQIAEGVTVKAQRTGVDRKGFLSRADMEALSVTELTRRVKARLEGDHPDVWVEGQLTNFRGVNASGHRYFSLKDEGARLDAVLFKFSAARGLGFELEEGQQLLVHGRLSVYEPRGNYQLVCDRVELKGVGALQAAFEQLKRRLKDEGLFEAARKRPLPAFPRRVALITSPVGAVLQDILQVTGRRCPWLPLVLLPVKVQGEGAKEEIAAALKAVGEGRAGAVDLVVLARGGGSLEDLWAFNEEGVARAIAACPVPVLSAVGHEVDTTIADFVADRRAPTPSAAAEILCPSSDELRARSDALAQALRQGLEACLALAAGRLEGLEHRLRRCSPRFRLEQGAQRLDELKARLAMGLRRLLRERADALEAWTARLRALSPLAILDRGYAVVFDGQGAPLRSAAGVAPGGKVKIWLGRGALDAVVQGIHAERNDG